MGILLGISTSSAQFEVVLGTSEELMFSSNHDLKLEGSRDVAALIAKGLEEIGKTTQDIEKILVDIGPGGTSRVRTGVAFANALSYSMNIPVCPVSALELMGIEAFEKFQLPVIGVVKSLKRTAYVGRYEAGKLTAMKHGNMLAIVEELSEELSKFVIAGFKRTQIIETFPDKQIKDSGVDIASAQTLLQKSDRFLNRALSFPEFTHPITEQSIFSRLVASD